MRNRVLLLIMMLVIVVNINAKGKNEIYGFGVIGNFNDSTIYITGITLIPEGKLEGKTKFLQNRVDYSQQLKEFATQNVGWEECTCTTFFDANKSKLQKKMSKIIAKQKKKNHVSVVIIPDGNFTFKKIEQ